MIKGDEAANEGSESMTTGRDGNHGYDSLDYRSDIFSGGDDETCPERTLAKVTREREAGTWRIRNAMFQRPRAEVPRR